MATDLVMFAGGTGTQNDAISYPCIVNKDKLDDSSISPSDCMGANGGYLATVNSVVSANPADNEVYLLGNFSGAAALISAAGSGNVYAYVGAGTSVVAGYYPVVSLDGSTGMTIGDTNLAGDTIAGSDTLAYVIIGGACDNTSGSVIETANDIIMNNIELSDGYNVDVYYNKDETASSTVTIDTSSDLLGKIRYIGRGSNFEAVTDKDDYPELDMGAHQCEVSADHLVLCHIKITGSHTSYVVNNTGNGNVFLQCAVYQTNTDSDAGCALFLLDSAAINCYISSVGTQQQEALTLYRGSALNCYVYSASKYGISMVCPSRPGACVENIIIAGAAGGEIGIELVSIDAIPFTSPVVGNYIYNFDNGIQFNVLPDIADYGLTIYNNVICGTGSGSYSFYNSAVGSKDSTVFIYHNFVYNCGGGDNFGQDIESITLSANPWTNAATGDFTLNDTAGGGALVKGEFLPTDWNLDGIQDNWNNGLVVPEASGGGGGFVQGSLGRLGVMEI